MSTLAPTTPPLPTLPRGAQIVRSAFAEAFAPPERLSVSEWADRYRVLIASEEAEPGPWKTSRVPYLKGFMDACGDRSIRQVSVMKGAQTCFTSAVFCVLAYLVDTAPGPMLFVYPNEHMAAAVNTQRLVPTLAAMPRVLRHALGGRGKKALTEKALKFAEMTVRFGWAGSEAVTESFPYRYGIVDELDRCDPAIMERIADRFTSFPDHKKICLGTPSDAGTGIDREFQASDKRSFMVPCLRCGASYKRVWKGVRWEGGRDASPEEVARTAWYECPHCGGKNTGAENLEQLRGGEWVAERPGITTHAGFHLSSLYCCVGLAGDNPYGWVAEPFVKAGCTRMPTWYRQKLGEAWAELGESISEHWLRKRIRPVQSGGYEVGTVPGWEGEASRRGGRGIEASSGSGGSTSGPVVLTMAVDVQRDRMYWLVKAWSFFARRRWVIASGSVESREGDDLVTLDPLARKRWPWADGGRWWNDLTMGAYAGGLVERCGLRPLYVLIDSGDPQRVREVYRCTRRLTAQRVAARPVKGFTRHGETRPYSLGQVDPVEVVVRAESGGASTKKTQTQTLVNVNTPTYKGNVLAMLRALGEGEGIEGGGARHQGIEEGGFSAALDASMPGGGALMPMQLPDGASDELLRHLTSEECVPVKVMKSGVVMHHLVWRPKAGRDGENHLGDCNVYDECGVEAVTIAQQKVGQKYAGLTLNRMGEGFWRARVAPLMEVDVEPGGTQGMGIGARGQGSGATAGAEGSGRDPRPEARGPRPAAEPMFDREEMRRLREEFRGGWG